MTIDQIKNAVLSKGYKWFDDKINIVSVRNSVPGNKVTNVFDDTLTISYKENDVWIFKSWQITTDPGTKAVKEFHNKNGVAILVPNQYIDTYTLRLHQGKYEALCQSQTINVKVFRDKNKDMLFDMNPATIETGIFGINIHKSNPKTESTFVENWSEGCSVFKRVKDFNEFMLICNKFKIKQSNKFTYTLLVSADIK